MLDALVDAASRDAEIDARTCHARVLLNLLQHRTPHRDVVHHEIARAVARCTPQRVVPTPPLASASFEEIDASTAADVISAFHFLGYARESSHNFAIVFKSELAAVACFSSFDLHYLDGLLPSGVKAEEVLVLNRLYSFPWAPRNTLSFLMARAFSALRPQYRMVLTYCNPNAGHRGSLYFATNWTLLARQKERPYWYVDGDYVSRRQLMVRPGAAFTESQQPLKDMLIFAQPLDRRGAASLRDRAVPTIIAPELAH